VGLLLLAALLIRHGLDRADKLMSVLGGFAGICGLLLAVFTRNPQLPTGGSKVDLTACVLHTGDDGSLPAVHELGPMALGVKPSIDRPDDRRDLPAYVPRAIDDQLKWAVAGGGLVLVHGRAAAGKTRSAYEAIRRVRGEYALLVPAHPGSLEPLVAAGFDFRNVVIWLDDVDRFLAPGGIDEHLLGRLCPLGRHDVVIVATIRDGAMARLHTQSYSGEGDTSLAAVVQAGAWLVRQVPSDRQIYVDRHLTTDEERRVAASMAESDERISMALQADAGFAEYLAAGPALMRYWSIGDHPLFDVGQALISAAVECRRAGYPNYLPTALLESLYRSYLPTAQRHRADLPTVTDAVAWACRPILGASSCLLPHTAGAYQVSDYLVDATEAGDGPLAGAPVLDQVWSVLLGATTPLVLCAVGMAAYRAGRMDIAKTALGGPASAGDHTAGRFLAAMLVDEGRYDAAEPYLRQAVAADDESAVAILGLCLEMQGRTIEAEPFLRRAAYSGDVAAALLLGLALGERGRRAKAIDHLRPAADAGNDQAALMLGMYLHGEDRRAEAEPYLRRGARIGNGAATILLGSICTNKAAWSTRSLICGKRLTAAMTERRYSSE